MSPTLAGSWYKCVMSVHVWMVNDKIWWCHVYEAWTINTETLQCPACFNNINGDEVPYDTVMTSNVESNEERRECDIDYNVIKSREGEATLQCKCWYLLHFEKPRLLSVNECFYITTICLLCLTVVFFWFHVLKIVQLNYFVASTAIKFHGYKLSVIKCPATPCIYLLIMQ